MKKRRNRYNEMERVMTRIVIGDALVFLLYLLFAGLGIIWLKVLFSIVAILTSVGCLGFLYLTQELLRKRSLWMSVSALSVIICTLVSLILNYPSPM